MATRRPLVSIAGRVKELPIGDQLPSGVLAGGFTAQVTVDFGNTGSEADSITVSIADAGVVAGSKILAQVVAPGAGRQFDEMEFVNLTCYAGNIVDGVGFDLTIVNANSAAHGEFLVNYSR